MAFYEINMFYMFEAYMRLIRLIMLEADTND